jgi:signal peptidase I
LITNGFIPESKDEGVSLSAPVIMELIEAVHEKGAPFRFQANGYSMTPAIRNGDIITVSPLASLSLKRGDVVAFRHPERPQMLVHRVLHAKALKYFIKGDNCPEADGWVPAKNILGLITRVERQGKVRFWPNRSIAHFWSNYYLLFYPIWPPVRRVMAKAWRNLRKMIRPGKGY